MKNLSGLKVLIILCAFCVFASYCFYPCFTGGNAVYYSERSSLADTECADEYLLSHGVSFYHIKAESAYFAQKRDVLEILKEYRARVVFTERVGGVMNYYCRSYLLPLGERLKGKVVNLHVAVSDSGYTVGTPIIYGGY